MTKNSGKGGKSHKKMKNEHEIKRELLFKEDGQGYAKVMDMLGSGRCNLKCLKDNTDVMGIIRGSLRKMKSKNFIRKDDIVLICLRDYQENKADIVHVYTTDEVKILIEYGEIELHEDENDEFVQFL
eukprot:gene1118-1672_t